MTTLCLEEQLPDSQWLGWEPIHPCPITLEEANEFVRRHHRHSNPVLGCKFVIGAMVGGGGDCHGNIVGVAIVGRPVARELQNDWTCEVTRVCTDGTKNACSFLYAAAWRAAKAMGYRRMVTYTTKSESGSSLKALTGWKVVAEVKARSWHTPSRPRVDKHELQERLRWEVEDESVSA